MAKHNLTPSLARCTCTEPTWDFCPQHEPVSYAFGVAGAKHLDLAGWKVGFDSEPSKATCARTLDAARFCPRHNPVDYSTHMARHATDSI